MTWQEKPGFVTKDSIEDAIEWLWTLEYLPAVCHAGSTEAILEALFDHTVIYFQKCSVRTKDTPLRFNCKYCGNEL